MVHYTYNCLYFQHLLKGSIHFYEGYTDTFDVLESSYRPRKTSETVDLNNWNMPVSRQATPKPTNSHSKNKIDLSKLFAKFLFNYVIE